MGGGYERLLQKVLSSASCGMWFKIVDYPFLSFFCFNDLQILLRNLFKYTSAEYLALYDIM